MGALTVLHDSVRWRGRSRRMQSGRHAAAATSTGVFCAVRCRVTCCFVCMYGDHHVAVAVYIFTRLIQSRDVAKLCA